MKQVALAALVLPLLLFAQPARARDYVLLETSAGTTTGDWAMSSADLYPTAKVPFSIRKRVLHGGKQEGSSVITVRAGNFSFALSPTRGMGILYAHGGNIRMGWDSPVEEVVNPAFINLESRGGYGWLEGYREMLARCGFEWAGEPVKADGMLYTLHGRAANTPASKVLVNIADTAPHTIRIFGLVRETAFPIGALETWTEVIYVPGEYSFTVHDTLANKGDYPRDYQIIYRATFGPPILEEGARFALPVKEIFPFDDASAAGLENWHTFPGPARGHRETTYTLIPYADKDGKVPALLRNKKGDRGAGIEFKSAELPLFTLWKHADTLKQGYAAGLAPGTCLPYPVTKTRELGMIRQIQPGDSIEFFLVFTLLPDKKSVTAFQNRIDALQRRHGDATVHPAPMSKENVRPETLSP